MLSSPVSIPLRFGGMILITEVFAVSCADLRHWMTAQLRMGERAWWCRCISRIGSFGASWCSFLGKELRLTGASRLRLHRAASTLQLIDQAEEHAQPGIPTQQAIYQPPTRLHNLARQPHHRVQERFELHPQHTLLLVPLLLTAGTISRWLGQFERHQALRFHASDVITI